MCKNRRKDCAKTTKFFTGKSKVFAIVNVGGVWETTEYVFADGYSEYGEPLVWHLKGSDGYYYRVTLSETTTHYVRSWAFSEEAILDLMKKLNIKNNNI